MISADALGGLDLGEWGSSAWHGRAEAPVAHLPLSQNRAYQLLVSYRVSEVEFELRPDQLRALADKRKITLSDLARSMQISRARLGNYLAGRRPIDAKVALGLARFFNVSLERICHVRGVR